MSRLITLLHPVLQKLALDLIEQAGKSGLSIVLTQTLRTLQEQDELYAQGRTKPGKIVTYAKGGWSYHNYGLAFDIAIRDHGTITWDTKISVNNNDVPDYREVGLLAEPLGLEWGGRWKTPDIPHFQKTFGLSINDLRSGKRPPTG